MDAHYTLTINPLIETIHLPWYELSSYLHISLLLYFLCDIYKPIILDGFPLLLHKHNLWDDGILNNW